MAKLQLLLLLSFVCCWTTVVHAAEMTLEGSSASEEDDQQSVSEPRDFVSRRGFSVCGMRKFRVSKEADVLEGQPLVDYVNTHQDLWRASLSPRFEAMDRDVIQGMMGVKNVRHSVDAKRRLGKSRHLNIELPKQFDARENWPNCASIRAIRDQSSCGSCWAFGAVEAMSDRICIASGGRVQVTLSADDLLSCCSDCGFGCQGGNPLEAWEYWAREGIVTGSNQSLHQGCRPYPFPACEHHGGARPHFQPCQHDIFPTPKCERTCQADYTAASGKTYEQDKYHGKNYYAVDDDVQSIQNELYTNGPFEVAFEVYEDFLNYDSGIYFHRAGKLAGGHAVKLVGWGEEDGVPYWLIANSWNTDFGEGGFFRIVRGRDECGIESGGVAGLPKMASAFRLSSPTRTLLHARHRHGAETSLPKRRTSLQQQRDAIFYDENGEEEA